MWFPLSGSTGQPRRCSYVGTLVRQGQDRGISEGQSEASVDQIGGREIGWNKTGETRKIILYIFGKHK